MINKQKVRKIILLLSLLWIPILVSARSSFVPLEKIGIVLESFEIGDILGFYGMEAFVSIHMTVFVLIPLSAIFGQEKKKKAFWTMFIGRIIILLVGTPIFPILAMIDFFAVFVGAFAIVPLASLLTRKDLYNEGFSSKKVLSVVPTEPVQTTIPEGNINATWDATKMKEATVDLKYYQTENTFLLNKIKEELKKQNASLSLRTPYINKRKRTISIIFAIINLIAISFVFFHFPLYWSIILELLTIIILCIVGSKFNIKRYLVKEITSRPDEKISNIISNVINSAESSNAVSNILFILASFILPIMIFYNPHILYEYNKEEGGYYVRFYTVGVTNETTVKIPASYKGKPVVGIRGSVFANMPKLEKIELPDTIRTIRGKAFMNDIALSEIKLPEKLKYLGGSAFKNCTSLESIAIPEGVTEIQGETFYNCHNLKEIVLPESIVDIHGESFTNCYQLRFIQLPSKITEIHGNTFENCYNLQEIDIPEGVTRIGGHAFYGCSSLSKVTIPSTVVEIGSSAFRQCYRLYEIVIPDNTFVNERAFKESPTNVWRQSEYEKNIEYQKTYDGDDGYGYPEY